MSKQMIVQIQYKWMIQKGNNGGKEIVKRKKEVVCSYVRVMTSPPL